MPAMRLNNALCFAILAFQLTACATHAIRKPESQVKAMAKLEDQAIAGDARAMNRLGIAYETGTDGVVQDHRRAEYWFSKGSAANDADATANLGTIYLLGSGVPKDLPAARALYEQIVSTGNLTATCNLGVMLMEGDAGAQDLPRALQLLTKGADAGAVECQTTLGLAYRYGKFTGKRDPAAAKKYLLLAADQGEPSAKAEVAGFVLDENPDDETQVRQAIETLVVIANKGEVQANLLLGKACLTGTPWPPDGACARRHLEIACRNAFPKNCGVLGTLFLSDFGGPSDLVAAERWLRIALAAGDTYSSVDLGRLLMEEDRADEAVPLLLAAAFERHNLLAMHMLRRHCRSHMHCAVTKVQQEEIQRQLGALNTLNKNNLAWRIVTDPFADMEDAKYALRLMTMTLRSKETDWHCMGTLAAALARAGKFQAATHWQMRSIAAMPSKASKLEKNAAAAQLDRFRERQTIDRF
jgi:TPR repeat protein